MSSKDSDDDPDSGITRVDLQRYEAFEWSWSFHAVLRRVDAGLLVGSTDGASGFAMRLNSKGNIPASFSFFFLFIFFLSFFLLFFSFFFLRDFSRIAAVCIWSRRNNFRGWKIRVIWARLKW